MDEDTRGAPKKRSKITQQLDKPRYALDDAEGAERADASNPYNTYARDGLPVGPIGLPGDDAIDAALHPTPGPWLYFVAVNLKTGETVFSTTAAEHDAAVKQWQAWCRQSAENMAYCT